jgi:hypothetical protein
MVQCEYTETCAFFKEGMADRPAIANMMKKKYCARNQSACARYMILKTVGEDRVPVDLVPNDVDTARNIIAEG